MPLTTINIVYVLQSFEFRVIDHWLITWCPLLAQYYLQLITLVVISDNFACVPFTSETRFGERCAVYWWSPANRAHWLSTPRYVLPPLPDGIDKHKNDGIHESLISALHVLGHWDARAAVDATIVGDGGSSGLTKGAAGLDDGEQSLPPPPPHLCHPSSAVDQNDGLQFTVFGVLLWKKSNVHCKVSLLSVVAVQFTFICRRSGGGPRPVRFRWHSSAAQLVHKVQFFFFCVDAPKVHVL